MDISNFLMSFSVDENFQSDKFLKLRLRVCHDGESPNRTFFSKEVMCDANKTLEYIPLLAHVYENENGKPVIGSHDMHIEEDKLNPGETKLVYDETPIGVIPSLADNNCTIEKYEGLNYTFVDCYLWRDYANYAEQLVEDATNVKLSMEIDFPDGGFTYDADSGLYKISSYRYRGITLLNEQLGTGMKNAMATTQNFAMTDDIKNKMLSLMEALQFCLRENDIDKIDEKGVEQDMNRLKELLEQYELTVEELDFEPEGMTDQELEEAFSNYAAAHNDVSEQEEAPSSDKGDDSDENDDTNEGDGSEEDDAMFSAEPLVCTFKISHDDIRYNLQNLLNEMCNDDCFYYVNSVYDKYFYYCEYFSDSAYKQAYKIRKNVVTFDGDPEPVYREFVTASERDELETMRANYAELKQYHDENEEAKTRTAKEALFSGEDYSILADEEEFKALVEGCSEYSVDECREKADIILGKYVRKNCVFSQNDKTVKKIDINFEQEEKETYKPYGNLFE